mgnify:CR=1 FL=1
MSITAILPSLCPYLFHGCQQAAEHPQVAHANPGAEDGIDPCLIAEYVQQQCRRHAHGQGEHPAPFGIGGQALGKGTNLRYLQHQKENPEQEKSGQDKISGEEKAKATAEIENVKKALEGSDIDKIKEATEKLKQAFYAMSEKLYAQANPNGAAGAGANAGTGAGPQTDANGNVYNADYKVEDDKKDENK